MWVRVRNQVPPDVDVEVQQECRAYTGPYQACSPRHRTPQRLPDKEDEQKLCAVASVPAAGAVDRCGSKAGGFGNAEDVFPEEARHVPDKARRRRQQPLPRGHGGRSCVRKSFEFEERWPEAGNALVEVENVERIGSNIDFQDLVQAPSLALDILK